MASITLFIRRLKHEGKWIFVNVIRLSTAIACVLIILLYARFHSSTNQIYRVISDSNNLHPPRDDGDWPQKLMYEYPAIEKMGRLVPSRKVIVQIGEQSFYSKQTFLTDSYRKVYIG